MDWVAIGAVREELSKHQKALRDELEEQSRIIPDLLKSPESEQADVDDFVVGAAGDIEEITDGRLPDSIRQKVRSMNWIRDLFDDPFDGKNGNVRPSDKSDADALCELMALKALPRDGLSAHDVLQRLMDVVEQAGSTKASWDADSSRLMQERNSALKTSCESQKAVDDIVKVAIGLKFTMEEIGEQQDKLRSEHDPVMVVCHRSRIDRLQKQLEKHESDLVFLRMEKKDRDAAISEYQTTVRKIKDDPGALGSEEGSLEQQVFRLTETIDAREGLIKGLLARLETSQASEIGLRQRIRELESTAESAATASQEV